MSLVGVHHVGLTVLDLAAATQVFTQLGFDSTAPVHVDVASASRGNRIDGLDMTVAFLRRGEQRVELLHVHNPPGTRPPVHGDAGHQEWALTEDGSSVHVTLTSPDPPATARLLDLIGLVQTDTDLRVQGLRLNLHPASGTQRPPTANDPGRTHLALHVADLDGAHARLVKAGYTTVSAPITLDATFRWMFVRDPGGSGEIELVEDSAG